MAAGDLTSLGNLKAHLGIGSGETGDDAQLSRLITAASRFVATKIDRAIASGSHTQTFDGNGGSTVLLDEYPVSSVTSVTVDGVPVSARATVADAGWVLDGDRVRLVGSVFSAGVQNCTIVYVAGYATTPEDIEQAVIELAAYRYKAKDRTSIASKSLPAGEVVSFVGYSASTASVDAVIEQYRRPGVA